MRLHPGFTWVWSKIIKSDCAVIADKLLQIHKTKHGGVSLRSDQHICPIDLITSMICFLTMCVSYVSRWLWQPCHHTSHTTSSKSLESEDGKLSWISETVPDGGITTVIRWSLTCAAVTPDRHTNIKAYLRSPGTETKCQGKSCTNNDTLKMQLLENGEKFDSPFS